MRSLLKDNRGCFGGGGGSTPDVPAPPPVAPAPVATETAPGASVQGRQRQVQLMKYGSLSTIANAGGAAGITGTGADLYPSMAGTSGKQTTGA